VSNFNYNYQTYYTTPYSLGCKERSRVASAAQMSEGRMLAAELDKQRTLKALGGLPF